MANIQVDTVKMRNAGNDIIRLTNEFNEAINTLYSRISSINSSNGGWSGAAADEFIRRSNVEKKQYVALKDELLKCGKVLINAADKYENSTNKNSI